ncbi:SH3 domain-containing protein [Sphingomonas sp. R86521]|uniref:SH3 domain-containing protein n=1 Tax=Sphingomonas sp. R86521 TaxID=3093860 RepID=UPI0036D26715
MRRDIADIRLAEQVFAPHYAVPMPTIVSRASPLRLERDADSEIVATLQSGDTFEVLELAGVSAWGVAVGEGLVGYIDRTALELIGSVSA